MLCSKCHSVSAFSEMTINSHIWMSHVTSLISDLSKWKWRSDNQKTQTTKVQGVWKNTFLSNCHSVSASSETTGWRWWEFQEIQIARNHRIDYSKLQNMKILSCYTQSREGGQGGSEARTMYYWDMSHIKESCHIWMSHVTYGVATISRLLEIIGLFCKRAL